MRPVTVAVIGLLALGAVCAGVAHASGGGGSIASAPVVTAGVQQAGNTSSFTDNCQNGYEFWALQLKQGDLVKVTWGTPQAVDKLALFAPGASDSENPAWCLYESGWSHWTTGPVFSDTNGAPATRLSQTVATATGSYPLVFLDTSGANAGPYSFTAVVLHAASVFLPQISTVSEKGKLTAAVLAPDSSPITDSSLKLTLRGYWSIVPGAPPSAHKLATAKPRNGAATFSYSLPQRLWGKTIAIDIIGGGSSYQPVVSEKKSVDVVLDPVLLSPVQLKVESKLLKQPIYWAGPRKGYHYEFTRTALGYVYVRYLPRGMAVGAHGSKFLVIATYPFPGAYDSLKKFAKGKAVAGPHGSIFFVKHGAPQSVFVAFPKVNYEIEVYDPSPSVARGVVADGLVNPVR